MLRLSLAAEPMAVTLPALLLLLDYWPLGRLPLARSASEGPQTLARSAGEGRESQRPLPLPRLLWEKFPLLIVAGLFCLLAVYGRGEAGLEANRHYSFAWRIRNAAISYVVYAIRFFYPGGLFPTYPRRPLLLPAWQVAMAVVALGAITAVAIRWRRSAYLFVGWLWYLGMLVPGDRTGAIWRPGRGRSVYLPAAHWVVHRAGLGRLRPLPDK